MKKRNRWNWLGFGFTILFTMIIIGVIYVAPTCKNNLQVIARILFVVTIIVAFAIIRKNVKKVRNNKH